MKHYKQSRNCRVYFMVVCLVLFSYPLQAKPIIGAKIKGIISQVTQEHVQRVIKSAETQNAECVLFELDTPGGMLDPTREIVKLLLNSDIPIIVYVFPKGSRAASAGVFITLAAHVAVMAPGTNIGAAHPLIGDGGFSEKIWKSMKEIEEESKKSTKHKEEEDSEWVERDDEAYQEKFGDESTDEATEEEITESEKESATESSEHKEAATDEEGSESEEGVKESVLAQKVKQDTLAWVRTIARQRGRNEKWAVATVEEAISVTEEEALEQNIIDLVAEDLDELIELVDGREIEIDEDHVITLNLKNASIQWMEPTWRQRSLGVIANPNIAYILLLIGLAGIGFEFYHPGGMFPGILGAISLLLAFYAFQILPVNYAGVGLILLGLVLFVLEVKITSYGLLSIGGIFSLLMGSLMLYDSPVPEMKLSLAMVTSSVGTLVLLLGGALYLVVKAHSNPVTTGDSGLLLEIGKARTDVGPEGGKVFLHGEIWTAVSNESITKGTAVRVVKVKGLKLIVEPVQDDTALYE